MTLRSKRSCNKYSALILKYLVRIDEINLTVEMYKHIDYSGLWIGCL